MLFGNRKGSLVDVLWIGIVLLVMSITVLLVFKISHEFNTELQASDDVTADGKAAYQRINDMYPGIIDNSFMFLMIVLSVGALAMAFMVRVHPVFIGVFIVLLALIVLLGGIFSNIYEEMAQNSEMSVVANELTNISRIMLYLPFIIGVIGFVLAIVMFKGWQNAQM